MSQNNVNENCRNPYTFLYTPECSTSELNDYIQGYKSYIDQMKTYCSQSDNIISNTNCNNFAENNIYIQNSQIQTDLKQNIPNLCKNNITPDLNNLCINTYNIKPDIVIAEESKKEKKQTELYIGIGVGIGAVAVLALVGLYSKNRNKQKK